MADQKPPTQVLAEAFAGLADQYGVIIDAALGIRRKFTDAGAAGVAADQAMLAVFLPYAQVITDVSVAAMRSSAGLNAAVAARTQSEASALTAALLDRIARNIRPGDSDGQ